MLHENPAKLANLILLMGGDEGTRPNGDGCLSFLI